jgi:hypothetical protein
VDPGKVKTPAFRQQAKMASRKAIFNTMNRIGVVLLALFTASCAAQPAAPVLVAVPAAAAPAPLATVADTMVTEEAEDYEYATYYLVVADTGTSYYPLQQKMVRLSKALGIPVDTMGRHYDAGKDLIALPDNDEDEIYAGQYYPRREPSEYLSLEYLNYYQSAAPEKTIALVRGIYGSELAAKKALAALQPGAGTAFAVKARVYVGCMH